jgi:glutathione reductase (NADPH)
MQENNQYTRDVYKQTGSGLKATLEDGTSMEADVIMYATGRKPRTEDLGLEKAGVKMDKNGAIVVSCVCQRDGYP